MVFTKALPLRSGFSMVFTKALPLRPGFSMVFTKALPLSPGFSMVFTKALPLKSGFSKDSMVVLRSRFILSLSFHQDVACWYFFPVTLS